MYVGMGIETLLTNAGARRTLRRLELEAYAAVVSAFRAHGPLTGEKKVSLEMLCKHLGISAERHRAEIRRAVNDELLSSVAECISGTGTETAWRKEGQKLASTNPRFVARQVTHLPQVIASATVSAVLGMQVGKPEIEAKKTTSAQVQNALKFIISQNPTNSPKPTHPLSHTQPGAKPKAASPTHVTATIIPTEPTSTSSAVKSLSLPLSLAAARAAATQSTQTVSTGVQTISASSTQALQPIANASVASKHKEISLLVNQTTETSNTLNQEPKTVQPRTPEKVVKVDSKPAKLEEPSSSKLPLLGRGDPDQLGPSRERVESAGVAAQREPVQTSVVLGEVEKHVETLAEVRPPSDKEQGLTKKHADSLTAPPVDSQPSTLPSPVRIPPKMDTSTSTQSPETSATSTTTANTAHSVTKTVDAPSTLPFQKSTSLVVVATPASGPSRTVSVTGPTATAVATTCGNAPTPTTRTQENRKRPLTPTSLPPPAKKPAPPLLTPTPSTPHLPIPALTRISVHTDITMSSAPTVDTTVNSPSTDFSHKRRYPPPPLVHAGCDPPPPLLHASSVALSDTTTKPLKPAQPAAALEHARGEVQLRTLLQGTPGVERIPPSVSIPPVPAVTPQATAVTSPPLPHPHPPTSTLPPRPASLRTPSPTPSNTDAFIQALCSDPSLEDSAVSALATQLGLDFIDPGLLAGSDLLQFMQPIDTEPVLTGSSAETPMDTQQQSVHVPQPVSSDKPLQVHSSSRAFVETVKPSPTTVPSGQFGLLMSPAPHTPLQVGHGMFGELCLQPTGETNPVIPDLGSFSSSTDESDLLEGIPQELAETIQALARLDEQSTTAYSPMQ